ARAQRYGGGAGGAPRFQFGRGEASLGSNQDAYRFCPGLQGRFDWHYGARIGDQGSLVSAAEIVGERRWAAQLGQAYPPALLDGLPRDRLQARQPFGPPVGTRLDDLALGDDEAYTRDAELRELLEDPLQLLAFQQRQPEL